MDKVNILFLNFNFTGAQIYNKIREHPLFLGTLLLNNKDQTIIMKKNIIGFVCLFVLLSACNSDQKNEKANRDKYETGKLTVEEVEKKSPQLFISVTGNDKKNLLGHTVIKAKLINKAKMVTYKDIDVKLFFYSKTATLLQEDQEMVYESIAPGKSVSFKSKYFAPKGTDSIALKVLSAKY